MKKFLIVTLILLLGAGIFGYMQWNKPHQDIAAAKSDVTITATDLVAAFDSNEDEANAKYNDKIVEITGTVKETTQADGKTNVSLDAGDSMSGVTCELDDLSTPKRTTFNPGEQVTFKCTCTGKLLDVVLVRCVEK
ncbi:MAG: hypothetical protein GC192_00285 [Bacteroidetes bacterium]|nr:hypothetical protein [Bacteroidota bacterium]